MKIISYVNHSRDSKDFENASEFLAKAKEIGCNKMYEEDKTTDGSRPMWGFVQSELSSGDTLVLLSFRNVMNDSSECIDFLRMMLEGDIRIISISDELDSANEIYTFEFRKILKALRRVTPRHNIMPRAQKPHRIKTMDLALKRKNRSDRRTKVINMYGSQFSLDEITKATGYSIRQVNRILMENNIKRDRCPIPQGRKRYTKSHDKTKEN